MTLIETIQAVLQPLAPGGSSYQINTDQPPTLPYIVFARVPSTINNTLQGASNLQNTRVQVDLYATTVAALVALGGVVEQAMAAAPFTNVLLTSRDLYEPDTKLHRTSYEFSVWSALA